MDERDSHKEQRKGRSTIESIFATTHTIERTFWPRKFNSLKKVKPLKNKPQLSRRSPLPSPHPPLLPFHLRPLWRLIPFEARHKRTIRLSNDETTISVGGTPPGPTYKGLLYVHAFALGGRSTVSSRVQHSRSRFPEMRANPWV